MSRPPQPPVYVFVIDTSLEAIQKGMIEVLTEALITSLDRIPNNEGRTRVGFITVSHAIGFYSLTNKEPELLMMSEIDDIYLPRAHTDLVVNLNEAKEVVMDLLERLKIMFTMNPETYARAKNDNCLGPALKAARQLLVSYYYAALIFFFVCINTTIKSLLRVERLFVFKQVYLIWVLVPYHHLSFKNKTKHRLLLQARICY
jgi:hypothetical protein